MSGEWMHDTNLKFFRYWTWGDREQIQIQHYPPQEVAQIHYYSFEGERVATVFFRHPGNAYLGTVEVTGPRAATIRRAIDTEHVVDDPMLGRLVGVFPHLWSWVLHESSRLPHYTEYGIERIEVENPPHKWSAYHWIPDPTAWGAYEGEKRLRKERQERINNMTDEEFEALVKEWEGF